MSLSIHRQEKEKHQSPLSCLEHPNEIITNYCSANDCLKPLCPECMFNHNLMHKQKHTYPEIESLKGVISNSQKHLKEANKIVQQEILNIDNQLQQLIKQILFSSEPQIYQQESLQQLSKVKKQILNLIEIHFTELEHKLVQSAQDIHKKFMQLTPQIEKLRQLQKEIEQMFRSLDTSESGLFQTLQRVVLFDVEQFVDKIKSEILKTITSNKFQFHLKDLNIEQLIVRPDEQSPRVPNLRGEIEKCIPLISFRHHLSPIIHHPSVSKNIGQKFNQSFNENLNSHIGHQNSNGYSRVQCNQPLVSNFLVEEPFQQYQAMNESLQHSIQESFSGVDTKQTIRKQDFLNKTQNQVIQFESGDQGSLFAITQPDYFLKQSPRKFLHFFQNESMNLFYFDLGQIQNTRKVVEFQLIELNNNFTIPSFHRSIASPNGNLYLVGGTLADGIIQNQKSGITYQFDFNTNSLQAISMMVYPRSSHGLIHLNGYMYAIGGYEQKHIMTSRCERMNPKGKWETIASLNQVCTSMSICTFNKYNIKLIPNSKSDTIIKFGGITANYNGQYLYDRIERYDIQQNSWKVIEPQRNQSLQNLSTSACVQINQSDILVFGGYNEDNIGSNQCYVLSQQDGNLKKQNYLSRSKPLPFSEAFWNSQTIIFEGQLFVLQNVSGESDDSCLEDERVVLSFNGREWKIVE